MYKQEETTAELIESFQPFMDTFGNLIQGGIGIFEVQGDEIRTVYINEGAYALIFGKRRSSMSLSASICGISCPRKTMIIYCSLRNR